jgi:hypothetical protein
MNSNPATGTSGKRYLRSQFIQMLEAALETKSFRFGRQSALAWLAVYPGDLGVNLIQARLLLGEGKTSQAIPMLDKLVRLDPEFADAYRTMAKNTYGSDTVRYEHAVTSLVALKEGRPAGPAVKEWGPVLRETRHLFDRGIYSEAEPALKHILARTDVPLIGEILHLKLINQTKDLHTLHQFADLYRNRHPDCLQFNLMMADALMQMGNEPEAVNLLHKCMSMDAAGQVVERLWGKEHPYRTIWPEELSIHFDIAIPADVAARLGWNWMLPYTSTIPTNLPVVAPAAAPAGPTPDAENVPDILPEPDPELAWAYGASASQIGQVGKKRKPTAQAKDKSSQVGGDIQAKSTQVENEFEKLAKKLKRPSIGRADGRFPAYVILSTRRGLIEQYGPQTANVINTEMYRLGNAVRRRTGWEAIVFYPDDPKSTESLGMDAIMERDPWKIKLAIADLDKALAKRGLMIGMMLIVGGPQVVPFHELPNPTDDFDTKVSSDNPYSTLDSNYFVPEWPIGRLPGAVGADAGPILAQMRSLVTYHNRRSLDKSLNGLLSPILTLWKAFTHWFSSATEHPNYGYTAAIWRRASLAVFRPVGSPSHMLVSPPHVSGLLPMEKLMAPELGYYNLHGVPDGSEWFGQRDPNESQAGPSYPVALAPIDLHQNGHTPMVVFSEACYGGLIANKTEDDAICLKFLSLGTLALVGSTTTSYGSISTPLIAADLLGNYFWQQVRSGRTVGESLLLAKLELVREMIKRQGYLDAEDQKTLLSFVLYGDPMVSLDNGVKLSKNQLRFKRHGMVKTIEERPMAKNGPQMVSDKVLTEVKEAVADYLPGIETAEVHIHEELGSVSAVEFGMKQGNGHRAKSSKSESRYVVTLSKNVPNAKLVHRHYARATIENDKVIKVAISR